MYAFDFSQYPLLTYFVYAARKDLQYFNDWTYYRFSPENDCVLMFVQDQSGGNDGNTGHSVVYQMMLLNEERMGHTDSKKKTQARKPSRDEFHSRIQKHDQFKLHNKVIQDLFLLHL